MDKEDAYRRVPFIWAVDANTILHRLVVSRELALACRDRRNYWRALQEMAGIRNRYVELAINQTRAAEQKLAAEAQTQMQEAHELELERVRQEAAGEAMQHLADRLLGMEFAGGEAGWAAVDKPVRSPAAVAVDSAAEAVQDDEVEQVVEDTLVFDEPWIDTPLCTSCNDCLEINPQLFIYNEEKQALLGDLDSATFAELVTAAELCPARCIHPGKPWNPDETGLDELIERAAPFNQ